MMFGTELTAPILAIAAAIGLAIPSSAATIGQPFLVIDAAEGGAPTGSILDNFEFNQPSGFRSLTLAGTVTRAVGIAGAMGKEFRFDDGDVGLRTAPEVTLGDYSAPGAGRSTTLYDGFDAFSRTLRIDYTIELFEDFSVDPSGFSGLLSAFAPSSTATSGPELAISVFLDTPPPVRTLLSDDPSLDGSPFEIPYVEGSLDIDRIEIGTVGGAAIPPIPLPAGLPLLLGAVGVLAVARRRPG